MRALLLFFVLAIFAMASAQRGKGNNPEQVHFVDNANPGQVNFVNNNPNDPSAVNFVDGNPDQVVITNPDPFFGQPSYPQRPDISPAFVNRPYPGKQYNNPLARGGK